MPTEKIVTTIIYRPPYDDCFDLLYDMTTYTRDNAFHILDKPRDDIMERFGNMMKHFFSKENTVIEIVDIYVSR